MAVSVITDPNALRDEVLAARAAGRTVGFVPTMGALHPGHLSLVEQAARECDDVAVSIFVNPTQFGPGEDFQRYPRALDHDLERLAPLRVRWVFAPTEEAMYPRGAATRVVVEGPASGFEGAIRPGHFSGVATVVCRLFAVVPANRAYFGAKDWQQSLVVKRMVRDLGLPIDVVVCPTVREPDGLAMSSRNAYLSADDRTRAVALFESLAEAAGAWDMGADGNAIESAMRRHLESRGIVVDYAAVADADTLGAVIAGRPAVALVAGRLGSTRLIDNRLLPPRKS
jgi:pantoate--beta-alanine ligase